VALALDPPVLTARKQIWMIAHPEQFLSPIEFESQKNQLARQRLAC
jgi:hypothetical protein